MEKTFEDTATAFALKNDAELERAYFLFKLISIEPLVKIGTSITNFAIKAKLPVEGLIRTTVFDHFCGGVSETFANMLTGVNIRLFNGIAGDMDDVITAFLGERLDKPQFYMPGFRQENRRQ